jgi:N,N'-diacetyllegionaminate synthase
LCRIIRPLLVDAWATITNMNALNIGGKFIGDGHPTFIIAEVGQAHDGSLATAHAYIDAVARSGADAVKFQTHIAEAESTKDDQFRVPMYGQDETRYAYWERMEFTPEQWQQLADHARENDLIFLSSAFSLPALELIVSLKISALKIASGEVFHESLISAVRETELPVLLSTGMSNWEEITNLVEYFQAGCNDVVVMQCASLYPTPLDMVGLNNLAEIRKRLNVLCGLSDHSGTIYPGISAIALGASVLELHVTFSRQLGGPDTTSSIPFDELSLLVKYRDAHHLMLSNTIDKDEMSNGLSEMRRLFSRSLSVTTALNKGLKLKESDLVEKKPGGGIPADRKNEIVGARLKKDVYPDQLLQWEDIDA